MTDLKTIKIKNRDYVEVKERVLELSNNYDYSMETEYQFFPEKDMWVTKTTLTIYGKEGTIRKYTGLAQEIIGSTDVNKTSALENCETSSVGRACAMLGIGIVNSIASADEITKAKNRELTNEYQFGSARDESLAWGSDHDANEISVMINSGKVDEAKKEIKKFRWSTARKDKIMVDFNFQKTLTQ